MKPSRIVVLLVAAGVTSSAWAKSPKNSEVPKLVCPAQFVYVETMDGDIIRPEVIQEDRDAVIRVQDKLQDWGRYTLVYDRSSSDIVFVVRTGRVATAKLGAGVGLGRPDEDGGRVAVGRTPAGQTPDASESGDPQTEPGGNPNGGPNMADARWTRVGGEVGPPNDLLAVYQKPGDINAQAPLWEKSQKDGLDGPKVPLFEQIRSAVDKSCQDQPKDKKNP